MAERKQRALGGLFHNEVLKNAGLFVLLLTREKYANTIRQILKLFWINADQCVGLCDSSAVHFGASCCAWRGGGGGGHDS